jgi:fumarate reductase subunit C
LLLGRAGSTLHAMDYTRSPLMKVTNLVALLAALLLTVAEFLVFEYDARQNVVLYQAEAASALAARG